MLGRLSSAGVRPTRHSGPAPKSPVWRRPVSGSSTSAASGKAKTVVISGASTGIGRETALQLSSKGWIVYAGVRKESDGADLKSADGSIRPVIFDVTSQEEVDRLAQRLGEELGDEGLTALVNNAGIALSGPVGCASLDLFQKVFDVNYFGLIRLTQALLPFLRTGGNGRIVNLGSIAGTLALPMYGPYSGTKFALESLSDCLRLELRHTGVKVTLLQVGPVRTPIWGKAFGVAEEDIKNMPVEQKELYGKDIESIFRFSDESGRNGAEASVVADAIEKAVTVARPRSRYTVGKGVGLTVFMRRLTPDFIFDWLVDKQLARVLKDNGE